MESLIITAVTATAQALTALAQPLLLFGALSLLTKRRRFFEAVRAVRAETKLNLGLTVLDGVVITPIIVVLISALTAILAERSLGSYIDWRALGPGPVLLLALVAGDFVGYWRHRLEHSGLLWPSHAVHHSDRAMTWLTLVRFHPLNRFTTALIDSAALLALGLPAWAVIANNLVRHWYGFYIHADLPWTYGRLGTVFVSPAMHRWHHVRDEALAGRNFAVLFAFWDRGFGTFHLPGPCTVPLGVEALDRPRLLEQLSYPFREWLRALRPSRRSAAADQMTPAWRTPSPRARPVGPDLFLQS